MVIYTVSLKKYETFRKNINSKLHRDPFDVLYNCDLTINDETYRLRFQVCPHRQVNPIQALRRKDITDCELITDPSMLTALTRLVIEQYGRD